MRNNMAAIALILVGAFFLLRNLGVLSVNVGQIFATWWPLMLLVAGIGLLVRGKAKRQ